GSRSRSRWYRCRRSRAAAAIRAPGNRPAADRPCLCGQAHARYAWPFWAIFCGCYLMNATPVAAADPLRFPEVAKLPSRPALPDPLVMMDGARVTTAEQWTQQRRPELKALFEYYMYGVAPPAPEHPKFT